MKKTATTFALCAFTLLLHLSAVTAQTQKPTAEYAAVWDASLNRWRDTVQTFTISYTPEYTLVSKAGRYQTTYSGLVPATSTVYQSRFFWDPQLTYTQARIDSVHEDGSLTPVRLDQYDRSIKGRTAYMRSRWDGAGWKPVTTSVAMVDTMGITRSVVNHGNMNGELVLADSTHIDVTQDIKGNVTRVKLWQWTLSDPVLQPIAEQRYTMNGDASIAVAEIWNNASGELAPALRIHDIDWAVRNKSFPYVQREPGTQLYYGGDGYRSATFDLPSGNDWTEFYQIQQSFDDEGRLNSYVFGGMARDTFAFDAELITLNQHDELTAGQWTTYQGARTIYDRDANGTLRSVRTQKFDPTTLAYVNDRLFFYSFGSAAVNRADETLEVSLFPNPTTNMLSIRSEEPVLAVSVYSVTGSKLLESSSSQVDVSTLLPGMYSVQVRSHEGERMLKFVKTN